MNIFPRITTILTLGLLISACGGGSTDTNVSPDTVNTGNRVTISGSVGDGPIVAATVTLKKANGTVLSTTTSDQQSKYTLTVDIQPEDFPLTLEATNGIDLVTNTTPDFLLTSVVADPADTQVNLNPHSTIIAKTASQMVGGLTETNLELAKQAVYTKLNFGLDTDTVPDVTAATVDNVNVHTIIYSSEALAEMVRRTSTTLGNGVLENAVINALAADLSDGVLDGAGTTGANPRYTAVTHAVSLQILLESMLSDLHVNGIPAEEAMSTAINTILSDSSETVNRPNSYRLISWMFIQARSALSAIQAIDSSVTLIDLMRVLIDLSDGATTEEMIAALGQYRLDLNLSNILDSSIEQVANATEEEIDEINSAANTTESETMVNQAPVISGTPATSLDEGEAFHFTPSAFDADGDTLAFSVTNLPAWASFNTTNGALAGTPSFDHAGSFDNIVISVSDGTASASLNPFSISVQNTNRAPSISGTPVTSVAEGSAYSFTPTTTDPDNDTLTFSITNQPVWASFNTTNGTLSGTPSFDHAGSFDNIVVTVSDGKASASLTTFSITVTNTNRAPTISGIPATSVTEGELYSFTPIASDPDGDVLSFSAANLPAWLGLDMNTGTISGTPGTDNIGDYVDIMITASDGTATASLDAIRISVNPATAATGSATLNWIAPDIRTDETYLDPNDIDGYRVYMGLTNDSNSLQMIVDLNASSATSYLVPDLTVGTYYFAVTVYDIDGNESTYSEIVSKTIM